MRHLQSCQAGKAKLPSQRYGSHHDPNLSARVPVIRAIHELKSASLQTQSINATHHNVYVTRCFRCCAPNPCDSDPIRVRALYDGCEPQPGRHTVVQGCMSKPPPRLCPLVRVTSLPRTMCLLYAAEVLVFGNRRIPWMSGFTLVTNARTEPQSPNC